MTHPLRRLVRHRSLRIVPLLLVAACAATGSPDPASPPIDPAWLVPGAAEDPSLSNADLEIAFWRARTERDVYDYVARLRLANALMARARVTGEHEPYVDAVAHLSEAARLAPAACDVRISLAHALAAQHRVVDALAEARRAVDGNPQDEAAAAVMGDLLLESGDVAGAAACYERLAAQGRGLFALGRLANLAWARGDEEGMLALLDEAVAVGRERAVAPVEIARCLVLAADLHRRRGRLGAAEHALRDALEIWPGGCLPIEHLAKLRADQGRHDESLDLYGRVVAVAPHPDIVEAMADVADAAGRTERAAARRGQALAAYLADIESGDTGHFRHFVRFLVGTLERPADALPYAERDAAQRGTPASLALLAWVRHRCGDTARAATDLRPLLDRLPPTDEDLLAITGEILHAAGDPAGARRLRRALELAPRHPQRERIEALLAR